MNPGGGLGVTVNPAIGEAMITPTAGEPKEREWIGPKADPIECKKMISLCLTHIDATNTCGE